MQLYFFRHAIAEDATDTISDYERKLTEKGIEQTRHAAHVLKELKIAPTHLYSSPLVRAQQTADILGKALDIDVQIREELSLGFNLTALTSLTKDLGMEDSVILVGHEMDFSRTISTVIGGGQIIMKRGGLARVDVTGYQPLSGELVWLIAPKVFNKLD